MLEYSNNKTSLLVTSQVPRFVREEHETFIKFLEYYYKSLESDGEVLYVTKNFMQYMDVDNIYQDVYSNDENIHIHENGDYHTILQKMYDQYIHLLPDDAKINDNLFLKHAKEFYRATGTEKSLKYLIRAIFGKETSLYYPKRDILRASDGKWFIERSLKITDIAVENVVNAAAASRFTSTKIRGVSSNAEAIVESVDIYFDKGELVTELKLSGIIKDFASGEKIFTYFTEEGIDYRLTANMFSGIITSVTLIDGGSGYIEGDYVPVESLTGTGGQIIVSRTTKGSVKAVVVNYGGAGFRQGDTILVTSAPGDAGTGGIANVFACDITGIVHPNSYNIVASTIELEANTTLDNLIFSNLSSSNVNTSVANAVSYWTYSNTGPALVCAVISGGNNYVQLPSLDIQSNNIIRSMGILGRLQINDGGLNYNVGDKLEFINQLGEYGIGASANVVNVAANGMITEIGFEALPGFLPGGTGYNHDRLPIVNVSSATGNGANIVVVTTLGDGEKLLSTSDAIGRILELRIIDGGSGYLSEPTLNLASITTGNTAQAYANIVTGAFTYPGRFLNDDGMPSSTNYLEDKDYYQPFSYVVRTQVSINKYRKPVKDHIHPVGTKMFGEYLHLDGVLAAAQTDVAVIGTENEQYITP